MDVPRPAGRRAVFCVSALAVARPDWLCSWAVASQHTLVITGTGSAVGGMRHAAALFARTLGASVQVEVRAAIGSRGALKALADRRIDVALSNFEPLPHHVNHHAVVALEYAHTPFVVAMRSGSGIGPVSSDEVARWYEPDARLPNGRRARPVLRPGDDVDNDLLAQLSPAIGRALAAAALRPGMLKAGTDSDAADLIEQTPGAFGATTLAQIVSERRRLEALVVDGHVAAAVPLRGTRYPVHKRLIAVVREDASAPTRQLLEYLRSPPGQAVLRENGQTPT